MIKAVVDRETAILEVNGDPTTIIAELVGLVTITAAEMTDSTKKRDKIIDVVIGCINDQVKGKDLIEEEDNI